MNEQINQLYQQALEFAYKNVNKEIWNTDNFHAIVAGKFAELIVEECEKVIRAKIAVTDIGGKVDVAWEMGMECGVYTIKKHFGVEE